MRVLAITPTGGRPQAFAQCIKYMLMQDRKPDAWCIVNDVDDSSEVPTTLHSTHIQAVFPEPRWKPGDKSTQHRNVLAALDYLDPEDDDAIVFIEDDDWYHPEWIGIASDQIRSGIDLFGEIPTYYYHVHHRAYRNMGNTIHASLASTAISGRVVPLLREILTGEEWIDMALWRKFRGRSFLEQFLYPRVVGIKGMPGRPGVSEVHRREVSNGWLRDDNLKLLQMWCGPEAAEFYGQFWKELPQEQPPAEEPTTNRYKHFVGLGGQIRYRCPHCSLDHYSPAFIDGHVHESHREMLPPPITLFSADDKPIPVQTVVPK